MERDVWASGLFGVELQEVYAVAEVTAVEGLEAGGADLSWVDGGPEGAKRRIKGAGALMRLTANLPRLRRLEVHLGAADDLDGRITMPPIPFLLQLVLGAEHFSGSDTFLPALVQRAPNLEDLDLRTRAPTYLPLLLPPSLPSPPSPALLSSLHTLRLQKSFTDSFFAHLVLVAGRTLRHLYLEFYHRSAVDELTLARLLPEVPELETLKISGSTAGEGLERGLCAALGRAMALSTFGVVLGRIPSARFLDDLPRGLVCLEVGAHEGEEEGGRGLAEFLTGLGGGWVG